MAFSLLGALGKKPTTSKLTFADIQWGDSLELARQKLTAAGYTIGGVDDGDLGFSGEFANTKGTGWVWLTHEKSPLVQKVSFTVSPEEDDLFFAYDRVRRALIHTMGPTPHQTEIFEAPFSSGDGRANEALRAGKAIIGTFWREQEEIITVGCVMRITKELSIKIACEGPGWQAELARREQLSQP